MYSYIRIFSDTNIRSYHIRIICLIRIYSDIRSYHFFDTNIFGYSFVSFFWYEYIRIFVRIVFWKKIYSNIHSYQKFIFATPCFGPLSVLNRWQMFSAYWLRCEIRSKTSTTCQGLRGTPFLVVPDLLAACLHGSCWFLSTATGGPLCREMDWWNVPLELVQLEPQLDLLLLQEVKYRAHYGAKGSHR